MLNILVTALKKMPEIKRGYSISDPLVLGERKEIGPYPAWSAWRHKLYNHLSEQGFNNLNTNKDTILRNWYIFRRKLQSIEPSRQREKDREIRGRMKELIDEYQDFFNSPVGLAAKEFINQNTQNPPKYKIRR